MNYFIFGLPGSGKTTLSQRLANKHNLTHVNADFMRNTFYPDLGFGTVARRLQAHRMADMGNFIMEYTPSLGVVVDFVCPLVETRKIFKRVFKQPCTTIFMNTIEQSRFPDTNSIFEFPNTSEFDFIFSDFSELTDDNISRL